MEKRKITIGKLIRLEATKIASKEIKARDKEIKEKDE